MSNFVTIDSEESNFKLKNLYLVGIFIGFVWILFHFTIVFFFGLVLQSVFLTGLFLGIGNLVAFFVDIPIGVLQKFIKPKTFLIVSTILMILACIIFIKFIFFEGISDLFLPSGKDTLDKTINYLGNFLGSGLNILLIVVCACLYGLIKEAFDVTTLSYIFNNSTPTQYANIISKYGIHFGIGSMVGLIFSGILLAFNIKIAIFVFLAIIVGFLVFVITYFDNDSKTVKLSDLKKIKLDVVKGDLTKKSQDFVRNITTKKLIEISQKTKVILLKPVEIKKEIDFSEVYHESKQEFQRFYHVMFGLPKNILLLGFVLVICLYGFWDTFVSTFQIEFLEKIIKLNKDAFLIKQTGGILSGYVFLGLLVIPAFLFQDFFINLSKKLGVFKIIMFGTLISSISMFFFGIFDNLYMVILFGLINSVGYAAAMPISQSVFSQIYNGDYAKKYNLKQIDSTISAAPLKSILNFANVVGVVLGGVFVSVLNFNGFFIFFGLVLGGVFVYSILNIKKLNLSSLNDDNSIVDDLKEEEKNIDPDFV